MRLLTLIDAAALLRVHPNTMRSYAISGAVPATKIGRGWRFVEDDLVALIRAGYPGRARMQLSAYDKEAKAKDRKKAEEYHDKLKAELWDLVRLKRKPRRTWDEAALRWLKEKAHKKSHRDDVSRIRWFTKSLRGRYLDQVSRDTIDGIISRRLARRAIAPRISMWR